MRGKRPLFFFIVLFIAYNSTFGQKTIDEALSQFNKESVPYITVTELRTIEKMTLLDTRKKEEYAVSHIKNAEWVGHRNFELDTILKKYPDKNIPIVVYCSIGVRSENIGEKLQKAGYTNVKNLYGGIFQWKNDSLPVFNNNGVETENVHAFSKHWGKLLTNGKKIYTKKSKKLD